MSNSCSGIFDHSYSRRSFHPQLFDGVLGVFAKLTLYLAVGVSYLATGALICCISFLTAMFVRCGVVSLSTFSQISVVDF